MVSRKDTRREKPDVLRRRAALVQTAIISVVVAIFSLAIILINAYRLDIQMRNNLDAIANLAETSLTSAVWQVDHASARDFIKAVLLDESVVFAQVVTGRETMAAQSRAEYAGQPFSFFEENGHFVTRTVEIRKYGDWIGTFSMAVSTDSIRRDMMVNALFTLAMGLALVVALSQSMLYLSRKRLFDPLKRLEEAATDIADGDLDTTIDTNLPGELGRLARATDDMRNSVRSLITDLQKANSRLEDHKNSLEQTVRERTDELKRNNESLNQALEDVRHAKQVAEVANLAKSRFLASMSHEIRTPMNAILGMADILSETELTKDQEHYVQIFRNAGEGLLEILDDILDLSKIEAGHMVLESTEFSLSNALTTTCDLIEARASQKGLVFSRTIAQNVPDSLVGDASRLKQILINLLGNAVKFTQSGEVHLAVETAPGKDGDVTLQFSVSDTGIGIPTDKLGTIFGAFNQADSSTTREFGGTGLGLAISTELVRMMGGRLWAESALGSGSTFHFTATFNTASEAFVPQPTVVETTRHDLPPFNILMLEDSKYNAFVIETYLKDTACTLTAVDNGVDGIMEYKKGGYDCILMDIQMPGMDGFEATRTIRAWEKESGTPHTTIITMTAHALAGDAEKCLEAGADAYLAKPVKKSSFFDQLAKIEKTEAPVQEPETTETQQRLAEIKDSIHATHAALKRGDTASILALADSLSRQGSELDMDTVTGYGDALKEAADDGADPARIRQILAVLSEYVERLDAM